MKNKQANIRVNSNILEKKTKTKYTSGKARLQLQNGTTILSEKANVLLQYSTLKVFACLFQQNFTEPISFGKLYYDFSSDELEIIMHSRKTLLFRQDSTWIKKEGNEDFDITMGCYDGAEI